MKSGMPSPKGYDTFTAYEAALGTWLASLTHEETCHFLTEFPIMLMVWMALDTRR